MKNFIAVLIGVMIPALSFRVEAVPSFEGLFGYQCQELYGRAGNPSAYAAGIMGFDFDNDGNLYIFADNRIIKNPGGSNETLFNYQTTSTIYGSFVKVWGDKLYFGESSLGTVREVSTGGGPDSILFTLESCRFSPPEGYKYGLPGILAGNYDCDFNRQSRMFLSANPGGWVGENKIYYWDTQTDPVVIADMGKYSGPIAFDRNDNLYYVFSDFPVVPEDVVFFSATQVAEAVASANVLTSADWTVYASGLDAGSGFAFDTDNPVQSLYVSSSTGNLNRIFERNRIGFFGSGSSPSCLRYKVGEEGGELAVLGTDWLDYRSTIFTVKPVRQSKIVVFRPDNGLWAVRGDTRVYFGSSGDQPVYGDYNGDLVNEPAVFRSSSGLWAVKGISRLYFGAVNDEAVPGDYSGEGQTTIGIFRPGSGLWALRGLTRLYLGKMGDTPVPADYRGTGSSFPAIFRSSSGLWAIAGLTRFYYGDPGDLAVPGDYNGDGSAEAAIYCPNNGLWAARGVTQLFFGESADQPLVLDYNGDGTVNPVIFRSSSGLWTVRGITRVYFGMESDFPASR